MKRRTNFKTFQNGVTMVELAVVLAIVGVVTALGIPSYQRMIEGNRLKQVIESFKSDAQFARTEAIKQSLDVTINRNTGGTSDPLGGWCYGLSTKAACNCTQTTTTAADYCELKRVTGADFSKTRMKTGGQLNYSFDFRQGKGPTDGITFYTSHYAARVVMSLMGRVRICTPLSNMPANTVGLSNVPKC